MNRTVLGTLILVLCVIVGCGPAESGGVGGGAGDTTSATAGMGGTGGSTDTGGGGATASTTSSSTSSDPGIVVGPPEGCSGNTSIAPATGQFGYHEEGGYACRRFVPPAGHPHLVSWAPAVGLTPSCVAFPIAASFVAPIDQTWPITVTDPGFSYVETPITDENTEPEITVDQDIPEGMAFFACTRLMVDEFGGVSCTTVSYCPSPDTVGLGDMMFSSTGDGKQIDAFPVLALELLGESPTPALAAMYGNNKAAWNTTATFE